MENNFFAVAKPTIGQRALRAIFPQRWLEPAEEAPGFAPSELSTDTYISLSVGDRLRILVSGKAVLRTRTQTDVTVNDARTRSVFSVQHPWAR